ncbi:DUF202 domain-containing protein [Cryobacterium tagatosivorans]|uniref:DUF202 domain-containing protein n=1 Tax=Cryobacterium tagatosivorans TaxID=1259199 RepID=UPI00141B2B45|nr:DUF202 domain-containing protein [Cryobacterium tagatosivorans]
MTSTELFDEGLQPERTHLAWQRTLLALGLGCAISARLTAPHLGLLGVAASLAGLAAVVVVACVLVRIRYRRITHSLRSTQTLALVSAWPLALVALATLALAVLATLFVVFGLLLA